jgi:hypothetical protein
VVFNIKNREIPIVHRILKVHEQEDGVVSVLTKGDNNQVHDRGLYSDGQMWLQREDIVGKAVGSLRYIGMVTIWLNDYPSLKYLLVRCLVFGFVCWLFGCFALLPMAPTRLGKWLHDRATFPEAFLHGAHALTHTSTHTSPTLSYARARARTHAGRWHGVVRPHGEGAMSRATTTTTTITTTTTTTITAGWLMHGLLVRRGVA